MVGYLHSSAIEEAAKEEKEEAKIQLSPNFQIPSLPNSPIFPEVDDFTSDFSDSFLDFDINSWLIDGDQNMADFGGNPPGFESDKVKIEAPGECSRVLGDGEEEINGKVGALGDLVQEKTGGGVVEMGVETVGDRVAEEVNVGSPLVANETDVELGDLKFLIEEQLEKVSLDVAKNCLESSEKGMSGSRKVGDGEASGGGKTAENGETNLHRESEVIGVEYGNGKDGVTGAKDGTGNGGVTSGHENTMQSSENVSDEEESDSDSDTASESESSSSSSSSSSSISDDDEDDGEEDDEAEGEDTGAVSAVKKAKNVEGKSEEDIDIEEGEIMLSDGDEMVAWSDDEAGESGVMEPVKSRNELKDLPPVPPVTATLQPHHQTQPVGTILSIIGAQVIVEGVEKHNPLSEGSILWITQSRLPLGIIDEIFGPVKNPYYIVRYNAESEVPTGIEQGSSISYVPEFANHVLNDKSLYQKGYDASGENDEELSDEMEFSDDEKEAEYKRMLKMKKRGTNESKPNNNRRDKKQFNNQNGNWNRNKNPAPKAPVGFDKQPGSGDQGFTPTAPTSLNQGNFSSSSSSAITHASVPIPPMRAQFPGFAAPNGIPVNGFPQQQLQVMGLPGGLQPNIMPPWMQQQQNQPHQLYQMPLTGVMPQQQINPMPGLPGNFNFINGFPNFGGGAPFAPWNGCLDPNMLNQMQFNMGLQLQQAPLPPNIGGEQPVQSHVSQNTQSFESSAGNSGKPQNFNRGRGGGRRGYHRGRGRGGGGRGRN